MPGIVFAVLIGEQYETEKEGSTMPIYLDNAATTQVCPEAAKAALEVMTGTYGNPSSTHTMGRSAAKLLKASREDIAKALGASAGELFFTSCGTESDNWALLSGAELKHREGKHIISSAAEHGAILKSLELLEKRGYEVTRLAPEKDGSISPDAVRDALREDTILVSLMLVNNETGGITDIPAISKLLKASGSRALLHCDAVQAFLKLPFTARSLGADLISISGHKVHAPKGIGALYISEDIKRRFPPLIVGGGQESGLRSGTEPLPQIAAFAEAVRQGSAGLKENAEKMSALKRQAIERLTAEIPDFQVLSGDAPHILSISLPGYKSEVLMNFLEARDIYVSKSSACKRGGRSYVLEACRRDPKIIDGALRIGLSRYNTPEDIDALCTGLKDASESLARSRR